MGRRKKYVTEEQRKEANNIKVKNFYWQNKSSLDDKARAYYWRKKIQNMRLNNDPIEEIEAVVNKAIKLGISIESLSSD